MRGYKEQLWVMKECLEQSYFRSNNRFYIQNQGLPMDLSHSPILFEIYMKEFENKLMRTTIYKGKIKWWDRYVDDVLITWDGSLESVIIKCVNEMNICSTDQNIKFKETLKGRK